MQVRPQSNIAAQIYPTSGPIIPNSRITSSSQEENREKFSHISTQPKTSSLTAGRNPSQRELSDSVAEGAGLAHDAGNLLQALGLYCELLHVPGVLRAEHKHYATELRQLSERSSAMIRRLLKDSTAPEAPHTAVAAAVETATPSVARSVFPDPMEASKSAPVCFNPAETLHQQAVLLQRIAAPWAIISVMTQDALPALDFSAEILERITVNLVLNAAEALRNSGGAPDPHRSLRTVPRGGKDRADATAGDARSAESSADPAGQSKAESKAGRIRVSLRMADGRLRLSVEDNGPGMPPGIAAAFLRPTPLPPGTARGLGHRIVHELAVATGGQLSIRVRPGAGTTFSLDWPVKQGIHSSCEGPTLRLVSSHRTFAAPHAPRGMGRVIEEGLDAC